MKTVAIIQARMGSTRLPGKVMRVLMDKTVLGHVIQRVRACTRVDEVVVATTERLQDDVVVKEAAAHGALTFCGSEEDVLSRYYGAAKNRGAGVVVRITSDCPLYDPSVLGSMLDQLSNAGDSGPDYLSNSLVRTFPRGLDTEVFTFEALARAFREANHPYQREHVTAYLYEHPELFRLASYTQRTDRSQLRWTLDTAEDWAFIVEVYRALYVPGTIFSTDAVLELIAHRPELAAINAHVKQKTLAGTTSQ